MLESKFTINIIEFCCYWFNWTYLRLNLITGLKNLKDTGQLVELKVFSLLTIRLSPRIRDIKGEYIFN